MINKEDRVGVNAKPDDPKCFLYRSNDIFGARTLLSSC